MADPQPAATVSPVPTGPVQPASPQPDDGYERISRDELQTLRRNNEKVRGMEGFYQEASKRGYKRPEDFGELDKFNETLKEKKLTLAQMTSILRENETAVAEGSPSAMDPAALEKFLSEKGYVNAKTLDEREARTLATVSHREATAKEQAAMDKYVAELAGEKASDYEKRSIKAMLREMAEEKRALYPDDHPLGWRNGENKFAQLKPYDETSLGAFVSEIKKMRGGSDGQALADAADAALKGGKKVSTPAGSSFTSKPPSKADQERRPGNLPSKAAVEAEYAKRVARRGGGPVSSMGG